MNEYDLAELETRLAGMSHEDLCRAWRFYPSGHPYFDVTEPLHTAFSKRWEATPGMTPEMSKRIGHTQ